ncbi:hypothetical protein CLOM_g1636 [Closterium sp. NIES-68]|nr:hypothetical protein CLOM_g1636 [Closterium sp. NIES-68]
MTRLKNLANGTWGTAFTAAPLPLFSYFNTKATCGYQFAFNASFAFSLDPDSEAGGDGLVFVVAAALPDRLGGVGRRSVGVEFDSVLSVKHSDPNDNHVGVNVGGSPVSLASATAPLILNDAQTKHAWIHYDPTSGGTLRVFLSSDPVQPLTPTLRARVTAGRTQWWQRWRQPTALPATGRSPPCCRWTICASPSPPTAMWGDQGHMRMDIRSGDGICGINTLPGLFPVVRMDVCGSSSRNPCVVGTCVNDGRGSYSCGDTCAGVGRQVELCGEAASDAACEAAFQALNPARHQLLSWHLFKDQHLHHLARG